MNTRLLYIFTRTPLHVGAGSSVGAVDQPVQRERHTGFPIIPGSSIKGVLRDYFRHRNNGNLHVFFGESQKEGQERLEKEDKPAEELKKYQGSAGALGFSEAKLLLFPLRSAKGTFAMATSSLALSRYLRDLKSANCEIKTPTELPGEVEDLHCYAGESIKIKDQVVLEEYCFRAKKENFPEEWAEHFSGLLDDSVLKASKDRFVLLSDGDFSHFALNACQINTHVSIDPETGTNKNEALFNEETVPSETLFYSPFHQMDRLSGDNGIFKELEKEKIIQFGGNSTTGLGFSTVKINKNISEGETHAES